MNLKSIFMQYHKVILYLATLGLAFYGVIALFNPEVLASGFNRFTGQGWVQFAAENHNITAYVTLLWRLIGGFNLAAGVTLTFIAWKWLQPARRWAWTALLLGTLIAYLSPMSLDLTVRSIEIFEVLEFLVFGSFVATMLLARKTYFAAPISRTANPGR